MHAFRTIEQSFPVFEKENLRFITVKSEYLKGRGDMLVYIPPGITANAPVAILLHGVYGSSWSWAFNGGAHITAARLIEEKQIPPMILAMPSDGLWGDGSAYLPHDGYDFEKWIAEDVPAALGSTVEEVTTTSSWFISGLSMGGFGALMIGTKYNHRFKAISAHSAITSLEQMKLFAEENLDHFKQESEEKEDCFKAIISNRDNLPAIRFDCGSKDLLIAYNRRLHQHLEASGIDHIYEEFSGAHEWAYWQEHLKDSLLFFAKHL
jgi:enterochelin esterase-like enzyme